MRIRIGQLYNVREEV